MIKNYIAVALSLFSSATLAQLPVTVYWDISNEAVAAYSTLGPGGTSCHVEQGQDDRYAQTCDFVKALNLQGQILVTPYGVEIQSELGPESFMIPRSKIIAIKYDDLPPVTDGFEYCQVDVRFGISGITISRESSGPGMGRFVTSGLRPLMVLEGQGSVLAFDMTGCFSSCPAAISLSPSGDVKYEDTIFLENFVTGVTREPDGPTPCGF